MNPTDGELLSFSLAKMSELYPQLEALKEGEDYQALWKEFRPAALTVAKILHERKVNIAAIFADV